MQFTLADFSYTIFFFASFVVSLYIVRKYFTELTSTWKRRNVLMIGTAIFLALVFILTWVVGESLADYILTFYFTAFGVVFFETSRHKVEKSEDILTQKVEGYLQKVSERANVVEGMSNEELLKAKQRQRAQRQKA